MNPETLQTVLFITFLIQITILIAFFVLVADVRSIKKKMGAGNHAKRSDLFKALKKAKFVDNKDDIVSIYKELAFVEVNFSEDPIESTRLKNLEEIASEIKNHGGEIPLGLNVKITELQSKVNKK
jgi:hypothetical protein